MDKCKYMLDFINYLAVDCDGRRGVIALLWKNNINLSVLSQFKFHIDALIKDDDISKKEWYLTGVYGHPDTTCRYETWDLNQSLCRIEENACWVFGDFNQIFGQNEKWGEEIT